MNKSDNTSTESIERQTNLPTGTSFYQGIIKIVHLYISLGLNFQRMNFCTQSREGFGSSLV